MIRYIAQRLFMGFILLLVVITIVFLMVRLTGDPADSLLPNYATKKEYEMLRRELGLDKPLYMQYAIFIKNLAIGDLGKSSATRIPVKTLILSRLPNSIKLSLVAIAIVIFVGFPMGIVAAVNRGRFFDYVARVMAVIGQSFPSFYIALLFMQFFAVYLKILPVGGMYKTSSYILPAVSGSIFGLAGLVRLIRSSMIQILDAEYIKMARMKGVSEKIVIWKHALRNALIPVINYVGVLFSLSVMTAVITETIFSWPGVGRLLWEAVLNRDFPVVQSLVIFLVGLVVIVNITVDIICFYIDPRIRYRK